MTAESLLQLLSAFKLISLGGVVFFFFFTLYVHILNDTLNKHIPLLVFLLATLSSAFLGTEAGETAVW